MDSRGKTQRPPQTSTGATTERTMDKPAAPTPEKLVLLASTGWLFPRGRALVGLVVVIAAAISHLIPPSFAPQASSNARRFLTMVNVSAPTLLMYQSDIVTMTPRSLLSPDPIVRTPICRIQRRRHNLACLY
ncbi:hypothetical protein H310_09308 [Aphanomyces invadans]|uniref:Uncharacterized protein n=1 Tax=Aphanomyces invadans TaxID=157072 RepID=A0A024TXE7_9STRA|nr:hypothetical protein H310_09308 [Aphanomyces invadans]ETV98007.1 hypothetical protein H310_09308 [Aphanomyces invadans]|eukprot:XP_008873568.1 hypothetical protein H310_09308 [Aphanomyces invadans]